MRDYRIAIELMLPAAASAPGLLVIARIVRLHFNDARIILYSFLA